jgi:hypothetical protein
VSTGSAGVAQLVRHLIPKRFRPIGYLESLAQRRTKCQVHSGPFKGMHYGKSSVGSAYIPKLLGIYERELAPLVEQACSGEQLLIVDIGAAEGYYAVGFALRNRSARVIAFEMEEAGRIALREMAQLNGVVERISIRGKCEALDLEAVLVGARSPLVVCDVEGYEEQLLDPVEVPSLARATILVEMHDFIRPGITDVIRARFKRTHDIVARLQADRSRRDFPWRTLGTTLLPCSYLDWAVSEWRPVRMSWLWIKPRTHSDMSPSAYTEYANGKS